MRRLRVVVVIVAIAMAAACGGSAAESPRADGVVVFAMPGVGWADVERLDLPHLEAFASEAGIAHIATRLGRRSADIDDAYLTLGAGTRALAPTDGAGVALEPDEHFAGTEAATLVERRVGRAPSGPAYLNVAVAAERNARSSFGAEVGALGDALREAGVTRGVVANADTSKESSTVEAYGRDAVTALMDSNGLVDAGSVSQRLLESAPQAPWGLKLDTEAAVDAFERAWGEPGQRAVLVEASDLRRVASYESFVAPAQASAMREAALERSDVLLGAVLDAAGPAATVLVVSPIAPPGGNDLAVVALRSAGTESGFLRSATTRRTGYVQLADVAPTVLDALGHDAAEDAEGRAFTLEPDARSLDERVEVLVTAAEKSRFRDSNLPLVVTVIIVGLLVLTIGALVGRRHPRLATARLRASIRTGSFFALGVVPATFIAHQIDASSRSAPLYALTVSAAAGLIAVAARAIDARIAGGGLLFAVATVVVTIAVDVLVGAPLQVNAIFGYSVAVAGRFAGLGNLAFALLSSAALLLAVLVVHRFDRRGRPIAMAILVAVVLVDGLPMFGADVGGVLSMVPAFGIAAVALTGRRIRAVHVAVVSAAALIVLFAAAFLDSARPPHTRTHLARLAEHLTGGRWDRLFDSLVRRWAASFGGGELGAYVFLALIAFVTAVYVVAITARARDGTGTWRRLLRMSPPLRAAVVGLGLLALLGLVANDSSVAVPATMLIVIVPVAVERSLHLLEVRAP